jgi:hypothetical protein
MPFLQFQVVEILVMLAIAVVGVGRIEIGGIRQPDPALKRVIKRRRRKTRREKKPNENK